MDDVQCPIVELRQYTLHPGRREVLIELFDREFVESQEELGSVVLGQFRDLDRTERFVWLRGFADMPTRAQALSGFYGGPVWAAHRDRANATMIDSDDVLLLRPAMPATGIPTDPRPRAGTSSSIVLVTLYFHDRPFDPAFAAAFDQDVRPVLVAAGATPLAVLQTEYAPNTFPALPVRTGEHVFAWIARFADQADLDDHRRRLADSPRWPEARAALANRHTGATQELRLAPTARSRLR
jgi:hypothetical protein